MIVDGYNDDGWLIGRTQYDAPDVDPIVFLTEPTDPGRCCLLCSSPCQLAFVGLRALSDSSPCATCSGLMPHAQHKFKINFHAC